MVRTLSKIIAFLTGGFICMAFFWQVSENTVPAYPGQKVQIRELLVKRGSLHAISAGNSRNRALHFGAMGINGYHLWRAGADMFEVDYQLRALVPQLPELRIVFIPISSGIFFMDNGALDRKHARRQSYYATTPTWRSLRLIRDDYRNFVMGKLSPIIRPDHWRWVLEPLATGQVIPESEVNEYGVLGGEIRRRVKENLLVEYSDLILQKQLDESLAVLEEQPEIAGDVYRTITSVIRYLQDRNIRPIFYTPPLTDVFRAKMAASREFEQMNRVYESYLWQLQAEHGMQYFDFSQDSSFATNYRYFHDPHHLNLAGAKAFSRLLARVCGLSGNRHDTDFAASHDNDE